MELLLLPILTIGMKAKFYASSVRAYMSTYSAISEEVVHASVLQILSLNVTALDFYKYWYGDIQLDSHHVQVEKGWRCINQHFA